MASEIRVNSLSSRAGLSTVTFTDTGPIFSGITTFQDNSGFNVGTGGSIFSPASNTVTLGTNNAERLRITSTGRQQSHAGYAIVGINTFASWARTGGAIRAEVGYNAVTTDYMYFGTGTNHPLALRVNNSNALYIKNDASRNVGIGTDNPGAKTHIDSVTSNTPLVVEASENNRSRIVFRNNVETGTECNVELIDDDLRFVTNSGERLRIDSSGHLLHGVTADEDTSGNGGLRFINSGDIQIDGDQKALVFRSTNNTAQLQSAIEWWNENGAGVQSKIACDRTAVSQAPSDLVFYTSPNVDTGGSSSDGDITERLRITSAGLLGVGVNSPATTLDVNGTLQLRASGNTTYATRIYSRLDSTHCSVIESYLNSSTAFEMMGTYADGGGANPRVVISAEAKNVGINETSPDTNLHISRSSSQNDTHGILKVESTNTGTGAATNAGIIAKNRYGWAQFMQWESNGLRIGSRSTTTGGSGEVHITSGSDAVSLKIDGSGRVTKPLQPAFRAGRNSNYSPGAGNDIVFNTVSGGGKHNVGNHYNTSNGRFTAPVAGVYTFTAHVIWQDLSSGQNMADCFHPRINGTVVGYSGRRGEYISNTTGNGGYYTDFMTYQFTLAAGDFVTIENQFNLTVHGNSNYTTFSGHLVC